jgi:hypothetical protein
MHLIANSAHSSFSALFHIIQFLAMSLRNGLDNISNVAVNKLGKGAKNASRCCQVREDAFSAVATSTDKRCFLHSYNAANLLCAIDN